MMRKEPCLRHLLVCAFAAALGLGFAGPDSPVPEDAVPAPSASDSSGTPVRMANPRAPRPRSSTPPATEKDIDGDGYADAGDNCPGVPNSTQRDLDGDGIGDACDDDIDGDGIANAIDSCPQIPNCTQRDMDGDGIGDVCDADADGDSIANWDDPFPFDPRSSSAITASTGRAKHMIDQALMKSILTRVMTTESWSQAPPPRSAAIKPSKRTEADTAGPAPLRKRSGSGTARTVAKAPSNSREADETPTSDASTGEEWEAAPMGSLRPGAFSQPDDLLDEL